MEHSVNRGSHMIEITSRLAAAPVVPLIQADDPDVAIATARALAEGGLTVLEVVLRTPAALECMEALCGLGDDIIVGAGTVLNAEKAQVCIDLGAAFIVAPGLDEDSVRVAQSNDVPVYPGVMTPTEVMRARSLGLDVVKFFPASIAGGIPALKALGSVFGDLKFMPTGGVSAGNLHEFLALPSVLACGGSWLTPAAEVAAGNFDEVTRLAREALDVAKKVGG